MSPTEDRIIRTSTDGILPPAQIISYRHLTTQSRPFVELFLPDIRVPWVAFRGHEEQTIKCAAVETDCGFETDSGRCKGCGYPGRRCGLVILFTNP